MFCNGIRRLLATNSCRTNQFALALAKNSLEGIAPALKASRIPMGVVCGTADSTSTI